MIARVPQRLCRVLSILSGLIALVFGVIAPVAAQNPTISITIDRIGYNPQGNVRDGAWFPVVVTVENTGADTRGFLELNGSTRDVLVRQPLDLAGGARKQITLLFRADLNQNSMVARFTNAAGSVASTPERLIVHDQTDVLIGVSGGQPATLGGLRVRGPSTIVVNFEADAFPNTDAELANFSALALIGTEPTPEQAAALRRWVVAGGVLLLNGGPSSLGIAATLANDAPGSVDTATNAASSVVLTNAGTTRLTTPVTLAVRPLTVAADATALLSVGATPLVAKRSLGFGAVLLTAFDVDALPVDAGRGAVWSNILDVATVNQWEPAITQQMVGGGAGLPTVGTLGLLILGYVLVVGPLNYLLLRRIDRREWAWATIPASVLIFMLIAYAAGSGLRSGTVTTSQVAVIDTAPGQTEGRVTATLGFTAGRRGTWTATIAKSTVVGKNNADFFFGADNRSIDVQQNGDGSSTLPDWSANVGETRLVTVLGVAQIPFAIEATALQVTNNEWVSGTITNRGTSAINRAYLVVGEISIRLPALEPGASYTVDPSDQTGGWPFVIEGNFDSVSNALSGLYDDARQFDNGNLPANSIYTAPRLVIVDERAAVQATVENSTSAAAVSFYNFYLAVEER